MYPLSCDPYSPNTLSPPSSPSTQTSAFDSSPPLKNKNTYHASRYIPPRKKCDPKIVLPLQRTLLRYFKPMHYWEDKTLLTHPDPFIRSQAIRFRQAHERTNHHAIYLGTFGNYCYYSNSDLLDYTAYSLIPQYFGTIAGQLELDDEYCICMLNVGTEFQRQKIGTTLVRLANQQTSAPYNKPVMRALVAPLNMYRYAHPMECMLTEDGARLIYSCLRQGILQAHQLEQPEPDFSPMNSPRK